MSPSYRAPLWLPGGHAQTIYPYFALRGAAVSYERERWETPDRDFIDLDWLPESHQGPLLVLFHGLEGSSQSHHSRAIMRAVAQHKWGGVVVHFRGCSGSPNRLPRAYHSGDHAEIDWILRRFALMFPGRRIYTVGISLGGNALLKWLAKVGRDAEHVIDAAAAISAPLNLVAAGDTLARGFNRHYTRMFLHTLKSKAREKSQRFPEMYPVDRFINARTLREFDDAVTGPVHGFLDAQDYWIQCSSIYDLHRIELPTLLINARNDPFLPGRYLPDPALIAPCVQAEFPDEGGHVGFVSGTFPGHLDWLPHRLLDYFASMVS